MVLAAEYVSLKFASAYTTTSAIYAYFVNSSGKKTASMKVDTTTASTLKVMAPPTPGDIIAGEYDIFVSARNNDNDGLLYAPLPLQVDVVCTLTRTATKIIVPGGTAFKYITLTPFAYNQNTALPYLLTFQTRTATLFTANSVATEIVVELPVYDPTFGKTAFTSNPASLSLGSTCTVGVRIGTYKVPVSCEYYPGNPSTPTPDLLTALRNPVSFIIRLGELLAANAVVEVLLPPISNALSATAPPLYGLVADVVVYTRTVTGSAAAGDLPAVSDYTVVRNAVLTSPNAVSSITGAFPTISPNPTAPIIQGITNEYAFALTSVVGAVQILLVFPVAYSTSTSTAVTTNPASATVLQSTGLGYMYLSKLTTTAVTGTFTLKDMINPAYIPATANESVITVYSTNSILSATQHVLKTSPPTWTAATVAAGTHVPGASGMFWGYSIDAQIQFKTTLAALPKNGVAKLQFPTSYARASVSVTSDNSGICQGNSAALTWTCSYTAVVAIDTMLTLKGRIRSVATNPGGTPTLKVTYYADAAQTKKIAETELTDLSYGSVALYSLPEDFYASEQREYLDIPVKATENGVLSVIFKPNSTLRKNVDTLTIQETLNAQFKTIAPPTNFVCKFTDMTTQISYRASSCTNSVSTWTLYAPLETDILSSKQWTASVFTTGLEKQATPVVLNGITFPAADIKKYTIKVSMTGGRTFEETLYNVLTFHMQAFCCFKRNYFVLQFKLLAGSAVEVIEELLYHDHGSSHWTALPNNL